MANPVDFSFLVFASLLATFCFSRSYSEDDKRNIVRYQCHETITVLKENQTRKHRCKHKTSKSSSFRSMSLRTFSTSSERESLLPNSELKALKAKLAGP